MAQPAFLAFALATPVSAQVADESPAPSVEPSIAPTAEPSVEPSTSPSPTPDATLEPIASIEPSAEPSILPTIAPESNPPATEPSQDSSPAPPTDLTPALHIESDSSREMSPDAQQSGRPTPELNEQLAISIIDHTAALSINEFDLTVTESGSAILATDKLDYAPTDTAIITGAGFLKNATYTLTISSTDTPATSTTVDVVTDAAGTLFYAYQLDGNYRPNYKVEAYLGSILVATITFTDSYTPNYTYTTDTAGPNDEPGQKDLNKMGVDYSILPTTLYTTWNWDDAAWTGGNTGDACNLFDTDNDGNANFSLCVIVSGSPATYSSHILYSCGDTRSDRCTNPIAVAPNSASCTAFVTATDPFPGPASKDKGDSYPNDTSGFCTIPMLDFSSTTATLLDVCSYPSQQPNSDPSDCIVIQDNKATLTIIKNVVPDDQSTNWNFGIVGPTSTSKSIVGDGTTGIISVEQGTYTITETGGLNTDATKYASTWACTKNGIAYLNGLGTVAPNIVLGKVGNVPDSVTCTFTNTLQQAHLTLIKTVTNDNGGTAAATAWTLTATGPTSISGTTGSSSVTGAVVSGGTYSLSESSGPAGYTPSAWSCVKNGAAPVLSSSVTLAPNDSATCTITNDDISPRLTVIKHVINDNGGTKVAGDFTMNVTGSNVSSSSFTGVESPGTTVTLNAGSYGVDETGLTGYAKTVGTNCAGSIAVGESKTCTITNDDIAPTITLIKTVINDNGGTLLVSQVPLFIGGSPATSGTTYNVLANTLYTASETQQAGYLASVWGTDCAANGTITLLPGENKTCTITNNDIAPVLTFIKLVNNTFGGTLGASDFPLFINSSLVTSGSANSLFANTLYTLSETQQYGYTGGIFSGDCATNGTITLAVGDNKTCYITNSDVQPKLTVTKVVINDNGGTKVVADFPLFVNTTGVTSGDQNGFATGSYTISETITTGYSSSIGGDCAANGSITLSVGDVKSCTITNDDQPGTLIVNKIVVNDNGGTAAADDFTYQIGGATAVPFESDGSNSQVVNSGSYTITEPVVNGYSTTYNNCTRVFVPNGGSATCTIQNDDQQAYLTLTKIVTNDNGGNAAPDDFDLTLDDSAVLSGVTVPINPGVYTAGETLLSGYSFTGFSGNCDEHGDITIALGESKTCTITNDDIAPTITLIKDVVGGSASVDSFGLTIGGAPVDSGETLAVDANTPVALDEEGLSTYSFTGLSGDEDCPELLGDSVTLGEGEDLTCTIQNTRNTGTIIVHKVIDADGDLTTTADQFAGNGWVMEVSGNSEDTSDPGSQSTLSGSTTFAPLNTGSYNVSETQQAGYVLREAYCDGENGSPDGETIYSLDLGKDEIINCTFINSPNGNIHGFKWNDQNGNGEKGEGEDKLAGWTIQLFKSEGDEGYDLIQSMDTSKSEETLGEYSFDHLFPGLYKVCEVAQDGWHQTFPTDSACYFTNLPSQRDTNPAYNFGNQSAPHLSIQKLNDATGDRNPGDLVTYTLVIDLTGSRLEGVTVTDLPPDGFSYIAGSWTASSNIRGDLKNAPTTEPTYGSPGTWILGDMMPGEIVTLTYQAKISTDQDGGTYSDIAWAQGESARWSSDPILALGHDSEYVDLIDGTFVGTDVRVNKPSQETGTVDIEREGEVLGAATSLPSTGPNSLWLLLALSSLVTGLFIIFGSKITKKTSLISLFIIGAWCLVIPPAKAVAADPSNNLSLRLEQPASPTRESDWKLSFSVLDRLARTPVVNCFVKKPSSGSFVGFGDAHTSIKPEGDGGNCQVNSGVMNEQGSYEFYVTAVSGTDSESSAHVTVTFDNSGPGTPTSYSKEHESICRWIIKFHTASDGGLTQKVEIYSSDQKNFDTGSSSRVGSVSIGSDQDGTFTHDRADGCDKEWYYVIRAFDASGNQSGHRGDEFTLITTVAASPTTNALVVTTATGNILGKTDSAKAEDEGAVLGQENSPSPIAVEGQGLVAGSREAAQQILKSKSFWWILGIIAVILGVIYGIRRRQNIS